MVIAAQKPAAFKVVLLGEGRVGKTSLVLRYVHGIFSPSQPATVQAAFLMKQLQLSNGTDAVLSIWDTAGQERFHALGPIYYRDADAALLVYDVTEPDSLERVKKWVGEVRLMGPANMALVIAANKMDLLPPSGQEDEPAPSVQQGQEYAEEIGAVFVRTSAKDGTGVAEAFLAVATEVSKHFLMTPKSESFGVAPLANRKALIIVDDDFVGESAPQRPSSCCS